MPAAPEERGRPGAEAVLDDGQDAVSPSPGEPSQPSNSDLASDASPNEAEESPPVALKANGRRVAWRDLNGACEELLLFAAPTADSFVPVTPSAEAREKAVSPCLEGLASITGDLCQQCFAPTPRRSRDVSKKRISGLHGHLWKLNADAKVTPACMLDINNWRRRFFLLRGGQGRLALMYLSEKQQGDLCLAAALSASDDLAQVEELEPIEVLPMNPSGQYNVFMNSKQYDIAFGLEHFGAKDGEEDSVPSRLYAFRVRWKDADGCSQTLVLASALEDIRGRWLGAIRRKFAGLSSGPTPPHRGRRRNNS